eukprot:2508388-Rhodomonas_salina.2
MAQGSFGCKAMGVDRNVLKGVSAQKWRTMERPCRCGATEQSTSTSSRDLPSPPLPSHVHRLSRPDLVPVFSERG